MKKRLSPEVCGCTCVSRRALSPAPWARLRLQPRTEQRPGSSLWAPCRAGGGLDQGQLGILVGVLEGLTCRSNGDGGCDAELESWSQRQLPWSKGKRRRQGE